MFQTISSQASKLINLTKKHSHTHSNTKIVTITSGKGGVGKSTFTANSAYLLSQKGYRIAILDADVGLANMQVLFDMKPKVTLFDYLEGKSNLNQILLKTPHKNITLIAGKSGINPNVNSYSFSFSRLVEEIIGLNRFDILIIDTGAGLNDYVKELLLLSPHIVAMTTTDPSALTDVYALIKMISKDKNKLNLCFNHTKTYQIGKTISDSLQNLAHQNRLNPEFMIEYIGNLSSSQTVPTTGRLRKLFSREFKEEHITKELSVIIDDLVGILDLNQGK